MNRETELLVLRLYNEMADMYEAILDAAVGGANATNVLSKASKNFLNFRRLMREAKVGENEWTR